MFIEDLKNDFYNVLLGNRVLLLVHYDVDAVCTCRILQELFKADNISYTLVPVGNVSDLKTAYYDNNEEVKFVVLVNCGGTIDLVDILQPEEDVVFFVLDSHKPTDVCNVYSDGQVRLVYKDSDENIPNFDDIFRDDDDEEEEEVSGREGLEAALEKRRERRAWEENRNTLMFNYTQFSYYGTPSSCIAVELSWLLSRVSCSTAWAGAVGVAGGAALCRRDPAQAALDAAALHKCLGATAHQEHSSRVVLEKDAWLPLYRWWSVESALRLSPDLAPLLKPRTVAGNQRVYRLLADMGFPLQQARQSYRAMDVELRRSLLTSLEGATEKHKLPSVVRATFLLNRPHSPTLAALDMVYIIMGLLEHETIPASEGFQLALSSLSCEVGESRARQCGAEQAMRSLAACDVTDTSHAGPFRYFILHHGSPEASIIRGPLFLREAARRAARASGTGGGGQRSGRLALVAALDTDADNCLLLGLPPRHQTDTRNVWGAAFAQAASRDSSISLQQFDPSETTLPISRRQEFLDALTALLA